MKTCMLLIAACGCASCAAVAAGATSKMADFGTPDESSVVMGTPPKGLKALADDPRYRARHYEIGIPEGEYWWGGEVLEGQIGRAHV